MALAVGALLGGLVPRAGSASLASLRIGALIGLPLAIVIAYANALTHGHPFVWQASALPLLEASEPGLVEEIGYRFALLVHTFAHNGERLLEDPLLYAGFGSALALVWGVPTAILAVRRDLESAAGLHWVQDAVRFLGGL